MSRPFYTTFAWAYDLLIQRPVKARVDFIVTQLHAQRVANGARLLDAGCGSGSYAVALAERGFEVTAVDASADLVAEAKKKGVKAGVRIDFVVGDILSLPEELTVDAILCRGVLNDLVEMGSRRAVFSSFARAMRRGGALVLDVREWRSTAARKTESPVFQKTVMTENGRLEFRSVSELQPDTHSLLISETHVLKSPRGQDAAAFDFEMRCWTQEELADHLAAAGFEPIAFFGDYDCAKQVGATDRLIAVAKLVK